MHKLLLFVAVAVSLAGCTEAGWSKVTSFGVAASVTCYSGGKVIYEGRSTGKVSSETHSDGYYFRDSRTQKLMEVSGECVITYDSK